MERIKGLLRVSLYILVFCLSEFALHYTQEKIVLSEATLLSVRWFEWACAIGAIVDVTDEIFDFDLKVRLRRFFGSNGKKKSLKVKDRSQTSKIET